MTKIERIIETECGKHDDGRYKDLTEAIEQYVEEEKAKARVEGLLSNEYQEQYVIKARIKVMDNVLGECIAINPKTREIDTFLTRKLLKSYEAVLKKGLKNNGI